MLLDDRVGDGIALVLELVEQLVCPARPAAHAENHCKVAFETPLSYHGRTGIK